MIVKLITESKTLFIDADTVSVCSALDSEFDASLVVNKKEDVTDSDTIIEIVSGDNISYSVFNAEDLVYLMNDDGKTIERLYCAPSKKITNK